MTKLPTATSDLNRLFLAALRAEFTYNRLALDEANLAVSVAAAECAEARNEIAGCCFEQIAEAGGETPMVPSEFQLPLTWTRFGNARPPGLSARHHLEDCREADRALLALLEKADDGEGIETISRTAAKLADRVQALGRFRFPTREIPAAAAPRDFAA